MLRIFEHVLLPGLFQTPEYAAAVLGKRPHTADEERARIATVISSPTTGAAQSHPAATPATPSRTASEVNPSVRACSLLRQAAREIYRRLMDAVDPALVDQVEQTLRATPGVLDVGQVRLRWIGHQLRAGCEIIVDADASAVQAHQVAVDAEHNLLHALPRLAAALVHADPQAPPGTDRHAALASHR